MATMSDGHAARWTGTHMDLPTAEGIFRLVSDPDFTRAHGGPERAVAYLAGYVDALEDVHAVFEEGARAFRCALALGSLGHRVTWDEARPLVHEARMYGPEEYCILNGVEPGDDAEEAMMADLEIRALEAASSF